ncbi:protein arginine N-methyltransferase 6 [Lucilia sericata]|uniref:protein arginine N-methyltransferase 6 n=1 Tax=Lucilia sericata TaxID=13632 RepID=UPI0018A8542A|nr:protein arginine N-methyltransferase 6 [Lucilia sericata]
MQQEDSYFRDYENLEVHEIMLRDRPRQEAYKNAILSNASLFKDKIVLDVGAGTGILSAFCAKAGAKLVYAVEASNLAKIALKVMEENNITSTVKVIHSKIEEFILPSSAVKVDIIVSEWMGFYLLHEGMLDSVLYARDNFLKPDGLMFPSESTIYVAPCAVPCLFDDWEEVDGVRLTAFGTMLRQQKSTKPEIALISPKDLLHSGVAMHWMNLMDVTLEDLNSIVFQEVIPVKKSGKHQGFCIWFDCRFPAESYEDSIILSTSPNSPATHWKQCVVVLPETACEDLEENAPVSFKISMKRNSENNRKYDLEVELLDPNEVEHPVPCECHLTKCILIKAHLQTMDTS